MTKDVPLYTARNTQAPAIKAAKPVSLSRYSPGRTASTTPSARSKRRVRRPTSWWCATCAPRTLKRQLNAWRRRSATRRSSCCPAGSPAATSRTAPASSSQPPSATRKSRRRSWTCSKTATGLMLGICNGFQALIKLGLVPYGEIRETSETAPTLTFNTLGRHVSRMVYTRITSVKSPWFAGLQAGDVVTVPVSHGEGRFVADDETLAQLAANGQVATQYVDLRATRAATSPGTPTVRFARSKASPVRTGASWARWAIHALSQSTCTAMCRARKMHVFLNPVWHTLNKYRSGWDGIRQNRKQ